MKIKVKVLCALVLCVMICGTMLVACKDKKDDEPVDVKPATTIEVGNADDLFNVATYVGEEYSQYTVKLTADIDLSGKEWKPIGVTLGKAFCGTFDGNGHSITGLKITGWESSGKPLNVAKKIIGWLEDGTPVYRSSEIVDLVKGETIEEGITAVEKIIKEGDTDDPNYQKLADEKGTFENTVSYGSFGLFGYTNGAVIKNLTVSGADISFYASDDMVYAGVISGYDVCSEFDTVKIENSKIAVSTVYTEKFSYADFYGTPNTSKFINNSTQYVGGVVGYTKSNSVAAANSYSIEKSKFNKVSSENFVYDNSNYSAYFSGQLRVYGQGKEAKLVIDENRERGYIVYDIQNDWDDVGYSYDSTNKDYPSCVYSGGISGYIDGAVLTDVTTNGFNKADAMGTGLSAVRGAEYLMAQSAYVGGISGVLYNSEATNVKAKDVFVNGLYWENGRVYGLFTKKATLSGGFGLVSKSKITEGKMEKFTAEVGGETLESVCIGGYAGYGYDGTSFGNIEVKDVYAYSTYSVKTDNNNEMDSELGSIIAGVVGVLRDSELKNAKISEGKFKIIGGKDVDYALTKGIVSQVYGNSVLKDAEAQGIKNFDNQNQLNAYNDISPVQYKNNYVNGDGYPSVRLYYTVDGKQSNVYITVYAAVVPHDEKGNSLIKESVYRKVVLSSQYEEGDAIEVDKYYYYDAKNKRYNFIIEDTLDKTYSDKNLYAEKIDVYRVEFANKNQNLEANKYYEYDMETGILSLTKDVKPNADKTYYAYIKPEYVSGYYLNVTPYTESGKKVIVNKNDVGKDDEDIVVVAKYELTIEQVENVKDKITVGTKEITLSTAEIYKDIYFGTGVGFKKDMNGLVLKYYDTAVENRNFAKYEFISGRPVVENINYIG